MLYSAEIRWFSERPSYEVVLTDWFKDNGKQFSGQWERADIYLLVKGLVTHGIKMREDKLEIKVLTHDWGKLNLAGGNSGKANMWSKYSFKLGSGDAEGAELLRSFAGLRSIGINQDWIRIDKERLVVTYAVDPEEGLVNKVKDAERPEQGCNVEFARLNVNLREQFYTFNFEAFGKGVDVKKTLDLTLAQVLAELNISGLDVAESRSFPEFIEGLAG